MSEQRTSSPPTAGELAALRKVVALTESQIATICALIETLIEDLKKTSVEQRQLEAELETRRQSLLEWTRSRDILAKAHLHLTSRVQSPYHVAHIREKSANPPTATPSDDELAQKLVEQDSNDTNVIRVSMDVRESTISVLRSRIAALEEDIKGCKAAYSHTNAMIASQASHKDQLQVLLGQYKSRLHPLIRLPDTCLQDIFLHVVQLSWEGWKRTYQSISVLEDIQFTRYMTDPMFALTAVCHRWRTVATHTPELWSKFIMIFGKPKHADSRLAHYVRLLRNRELSILIMFPGKSDIQSLEIIKSRNVKLATLVLFVPRSRHNTEQAMKILPSPRSLILLAFDVDFLPMSLPQELLSRTEELYTEGCHMTTELPAPTLQRLELSLENLWPSTPPLHCIPSFLQNCPQLHYLSIWCQTSPGILDFSAQPLSLLVSPGVCESVTYLQIPAMALCGPLKALRTSFTLPNLVHLSLLQFLNEGSDLQSWSNFCRLNGGKVKRLDLDVPRRAYLSQWSRSNPFLPDNLELEFTQHLYCLTGINYLSVHALYVHLLMLALAKDVNPKTEEGRKPLLVPNMEICEIRQVNDSAVRPLIEKVFSCWSETRNIKEGNEATGQRVATTVLWT